MEPLYQDSTIRIEYAPENHEDHIVRIGEVTFHMQRGILNELSQTKGIENIERKLKTIYAGKINYCLGRNGLSSADLALAISQARICELEQEVKYSIREARDYKEKAEELEEEVKDFQEKAKNLSHQVL